jgi:hypothetical protein
VIEIITIWDYTLLMLILWISTLIIGIVIFKQPNALILGMIIFFGMLIGGLAYGETFDENYIIEDTIDVWYTDAPFGNYWVETEGWGNFIRFSIESELRESYTIKYLEGNKVESMYFDTSEDLLDVYLTDDVNNMTLICENHYRRNNWYEVDYLKSTSYKLYIPNPDLF